MKKGLLIFGTKSTAIEIKEISELDYSFDKIYLIGIENDLENNIIAESELNQIDMDFEWFYIISMANHDVRKKCINLAEKLSFKLKSIISKSTYISKSAKIGYGTYIAPNVSISSHTRISDHVIINFNSCKIIKMLEY